jgi:hypothetical protein
MPSPRFRTATLMAVIAALGVGIAALRLASEAWASTLFTSTLLLLATALLMAIGRGPAGLRWWGLAVFGAAYLFTSLLPDGRAQLATARYLDPLYFAVHVDSQPMLPVYPSPVKADLVIDSKHYSMTPTFAGQRPMLYTWPDRTKLESFRRVGHALCALGAGLLGGLVGHLIAARRDRRSTPAPAG